MRSVQPVRIWGVRTPRGVGRGALVMVRLGREGGEEDMCVEWSGLDWTGLTYVLACAGGIGYAVDGTWLWWVRWLAGRFGVFNDVIGIGIEIDIDDAGSIAYHCDL